jgi:hypothetical protein
MAEETLTIALDGNISLSDFAETIRQFEALVDALSDEVGGDQKVEWQLEDLHVGSAIATVRGVSADLETTDRIIRSFAVVGDALQRQESIPYSPKVRDKALALARSVKGSIIGIRFETPYSVATIAQHDVGQPMLDIVYQYGQIAGTVQTLMKRRGPRFILYDSVFDRPIPCYLEPGQEDMVRDLWERSVVVVGEIGRDQMLFRPMAVRRIERVEIIEEEPLASYLQARGVLPKAEGEPNSEEVVRSMRDGW